MQYESLRTLTINGTTVPATVPTSVVARYMRANALYTCVVELSWCEYLGWFIYDAEDNTLIWSEELS
jgi:hypothetical protein